MKENSLENLYNTKQDQSLPASKTNYNSFIYIWFNKVKRMFYIGKHFGSINDGYICSSKKMMQEYKKRPSDFRRKILTYVIDTTGYEILNAELKWMSYINDENLGKKYYNLKIKILETQEVVLKAIYGTKD